MQDEILKLDRRSTLSGTLLGASSLVVIGLALFAPVDGQTKFAAIGGATAIGTFASPGIANSNKVTSVIDEKGQF